MRLARGRFDASDLLGRFPDPWFDSGEWTVDHVGIAIGSARKSQLRHWASQGYRAAAVPWAHRRFQDAALDSSGWHDAAGHSGKACSPARRWPRADPCNRKRRSACPLPTAARGRRDRAGDAVASIVFADWFPANRAGSTRTDCAGAVTAASDARGHRCPAGWRPERRDRPHAASPGRPSAAEPPITQEKISVLLQEGTKAGVFEEGEHEMIKRVFRFSDRRARALMTPRNDIIWIDQADPADEIRRKIVKSHHTRFPVCDQSLDDSR